MIPVKLLFMAHIQYLGSAWRNYIRSILLHSQFRAGLLCHYWCLRTWLYIDCGHDYNPDQDHNIPGLSPSHLEIEITEYDVS